MSKKEKSTCYHFDVDLRSGIREDEDQYDKGRIESLIGKDVAVHNRSLIRLSGDHVEYVSMRGDEDEDILEEDELTGDGEGEQDGGEQSPAEEEGAVDHSPLVVLVYLQDKSVVVLLCFFYLE
jgi:hypothetical protein